MGLSFNLLFIKLDESSPKTESDFFEELNLNFSVVEKSLGFRKLCEAQNIKLDKYFGVVHKLSLIHI